MGVDVVGGACLTHWAWASEHSRRDLRVSGGAGPLHSHTSTCTGVSVKSQGPGC